MQNSKAAQQFEIAQKRLYIKPFQKGGAQQMLWTANDNNKATKALAAARSKAKGKLRLVVLDSYLKCADQLAAEGKKSEASAIYRQLSKEPAPIGAAALRGMVTVIR